MKAATVRFYADADILGVGKLLAGLRNDLTFPGDQGATIHKRARPPCAITTTRTIDSVWLPIVCKQQLLILTRDGKIRQHRAEISAVIENRGRMVALSSDDATNVWAQLEVIMTQWRRIEDLVDLPGPFIYTATRSSLVKIV